MHRLLEAHPDHPPRAVTAVTVGIAPVPDGLALDYRLEGRIAGLVIPPPRQPRRADGLWNETCLEAFFRKAGAPGYLEFNFSPSTEWAAYAFDGYREGMRPLDLAHSPVVSSFDREHALEVHVTLPIDPGPWLAGLSAVIEEADGTRSFWALAHPAGEPDFHHPDSFILPLTD